MTRRPAPFAWNRRELSVAAKIIAVVLAATAVWGCAPVSGLDSWRSDAHRVSVERFPAGWTAVSADDDRLTLEKYFRHDGLGYLERITVSVSHDDFASIDDTLARLRANGLRLVERDRVNIADDAAPFWFLVGRRGRVEVVWLAVIQRFGRAYTIQLQATPLDVDAEGDLGQLAGALRFMVDDRERAWWDFLAGRDGAAETAFAALVRRQPADGNARYGLGLALLAQGKSEQAVGHLQQARKIIGIHENVSKSIARALLDSGDVQRATVLAVEMLREDTDLNGYLWPWLAARSDVFGRLAKRPPTQARQALWNRVTAAAAALILFFQKTEIDLAIDVNAATGYGGVEALQRRLGQALSGLLWEAHNGPVDGRYLNALLGALEIEQGADAGLRALRAGDVAGLRTAGLRLAAGLQKLKGYADDDG